MLLELYRGQRPSAEAAAKGAAKGLLLGIAAGVGEGLLTAGLTKVVYGHGNLGESVKAGVILGGSSGALAGGIRGANEGESVWERVTVFQLRQQLCRCPDPDARKEPLIAKSP